MLFCISDSDIYSEIIEGKGSSSCNGESHFQLFLWAYIIEWHQLSNISLNQGKAKGLVRQLKKVTVSEYIYSLHLTILGGKTLFLCFACAVGCRFLFQPNHSTTSISGTTLHSCLLNSLYLTFTHMPSQW